jgi:hypothetical protein
VRVAGCQCECWYVYLTRCGAVRIVVP